MCVWSRRSAEGSDCLRVVLTPPTDPSTKSVEFWREAVSFLSCLARGNCSSRADSLLSLVSWSDCYYEKWHIDCVDGTDCGCLFGIGCYLSDFGEKTVEWYRLDSVSCSGLGSVHCSKISVHYDCYSPFQDLETWKQRKISDHLRGALQSAASPAGRTLLRTSILTRCFPRTGVCTVTTGSQWGSLVLRCPPRLLFPPLWQGRPAFSPSPRLKSASLRGSCHGGGKDVAELPPGLCYLGSLEYQGAAG